MRILIAIVLTLPLLLAAVSIAHHVAYQVISSRGVFCEGTPHTIAAVGRSGEASARGFSTNQVCWPSGIGVKQGQRYEVTLAADGEWLDLTLRTDVAGLPTFGLPHWVAWPLKRYWTLNWFAPVLRVGDDNGTEMPMTPAGPPGRYEDVKVEVIDRFSPLPKGDVDRIMAAPPISDGPRVATARFTAERDGEVFIFVNDALVLVPGCKDLFYRNNHGGGTLIVRRIDAPNS